MNRQFETYNIEQYTIFWTFFTTIGNVSSVVLNYISRIEHPSIYHFSLIQRLSIIIHSRNYVLLRTIKQ